MKKINWQLTSNIAVILSMLAVLIGFTFLATQMSKFRQRLERLELNYSIIEGDFNQLYEIDPGIKKVD